MPGGRRSHHDLGRGGYGSHAERGILTRDARPVVLRRGRDVRRVRPVLPGPEPEHAGRRRSRSPTCGRRRQHRWSRRTRRPAEPLQHLGEHRGADGPGARALATRSVGRDRVHQRRADHRRARDVPELGAGRLSTPGHESAGVTTPSTQWFLAEGATGDFFDLFVLIANPKATPAHGAGRLPAADRAGDHAHLHGARQQPLQHLGGPRGPAAGQHRGLDAGDAPPTACRSSSSARCGGRADVDHVARGAQQPGRRTTGTRGRWPKARSAGRVARNLRPDRQHVGVRRPGRVTSCSRTASRRARRLCRSPPAAG